MSTQLLRARAGDITAQMEAVAAKESVPVDEVCALLASGRAVLPANPAHIKLDPEIVGRRFRTKVNANLGRSADKSCLDEERAKVTTALTAGADFVMDLSVGADLGTLRRGLLEICPAPFGTVPIYEALSRIDGNTDAITADLLLTVIRDQAEQGVDFMTIHAGLLRGHVDLALKRIMGIASRGGAILARWMAKYDQENPLYTPLDAILDICR